MSYEVFALKWRPKNFSELIGQKAVQTTLTNALKNNRLPPVCLFTGPRGTGKTSTARILAKTLRCQEKKDFLSPCNTCEECRLIQKSQSLDVIEIDGASNNGVEAVRELRNTLNYMPSKGSKKIYIIDEVHMLSTSAFNALLKTLEEPPRHVLFIMATTEAQKIPLTVISRCQKFDFHLISPKLIKDHLEKICRKEGLSIDDKALWLITRQAQGSLRDGQSLLDQMATFCNKIITFEKVIEILGLSDPMLLSKTLKVLCERDEKQMVRIINEQRTTGVDSKLFLQVLIEGLRDLLVLKQNPENNPPLVNRSNQEMEEMKTFSSQISPEDLHFLFDMALKGERDMNLCHDSQLTLEVLLLRLSQTPRLESLIPLNPFAEEKSTLSEKSTSNKEVSSKPSSQQEFSSNHKKKPTSFTKEETLWLQFIEFLTPRNPSLAGTLANLSLKEQLGNNFIFFEPSFEYIKTKIMEPETFLFLKKQLNLFLKSPTNEFTIQFQNSLKKEPSLTLKTLKQKKEKDELLKEAHLDPFIQKLNQTFEGDIKSIQSKSH